MKSARIISSVFYDRETKDLFVQYEGSDETEPFQSKHMTKEQKGLIQITGDHLRILVPTKILDLRE